MLSNFPQTRNTYAIIYISQSKKQQALRIAKSVQRKDYFTLHDGQIIFHQDSPKSSSQFEINMIEEIIREVCTMYQRRLRLYEPIVNSLMDRVTNEAFSPTGMHKLVPVKDSLQHFGMYHSFAFSI